MAEVIGYRDSRVGHYRYAAFRGSRLIGCLFVSPEPVQVSRAWLTEQMRETYATPHSRMGLLAGRSGVAGEEPGSIICSCFRVGINQIQAAADRGCATTQAIGATLKAGTNCGSCLGEIRLILSSRMRQSA